MEAFIVILMVAGVAIVVAAAKSGDSGSESIWSTAAQRLGLQYTHSDLQSSPTISGTRRGLSVHISTFAKSEDFNRQYTRYRIDFQESLGLGLRLTLDNPLASVSRKLGSQDIETGDEDFDETVIVKGRDPERVRRFLTYSRRTQAERFLTLYSSATIDDSGIECEERNVARSPDRIVQTIQRMTTIAEQFSRYDEEGSDYAAIIGDPDDAELEGHTLILPERTEPWPISLDEMLQVEGITAGVEEQAHSFFDDSEPTNVHTLPESDQTDLDAHIPEELVSAEQPHSHDDGTDIRSVVQTLYAQGHTTSQTTEQFESEFKNKKVAWSGKLTNVRSYRFDLVFGDVPGTRAEFEVGDAPDSAAAGRAVKAVVRFPADVEDELRAQVDNRVTFQGILISCDAFMKTLFLEDGKICEVDV